MPEIRLDLYTQTSRKTLTPVMPQIRVNSQKWRKTFTPVMLEFILKNREKSEMSQIRQNSQAGLETIADNKIKQ